MTVAEMKKWVDNASLEELLIKNKFEPYGSPWFNHKKLGSYILDRIEKFRNEAPSAYKITYENVDLMTKEELNLEV